MSEWIRVEDRLPEEPDVQKTIEECDLRPYCDEKECTDCSKGEYLVTIRWNDGSPDETTSLLYAGNGRWEDIEGVEYDDVVIAWMELPKPWKDTTKYKWKLAPWGWGALRTTYLTAVGPALMVADGFVAIDKNDHKNIFTEEEFKYLSEKWKFDPDLFEREEVQDYESRGSEA